jgi:hypothetical protein
LPWYWCRGVSVSDAMKEQDLPGTLTIAAVPIGCLEDASPRHQYHGNR